MLLVDAEVMSPVKGGILVDVMGLRGFVPSSHIRAKDLEGLSRTNYSAKSIISGC